MFVSSLVCPILKGRASMFGSTAILEQVEYDL